MQFLREIIFTCSYSLMTHTFYFVKVTYGVTIWKLEVSF